MKVFTFTTTDPECPEGARAVARIRCETLGRGGKLAVDWSPLIFTASTTEEAEAQARQWWADEVARYRALKPQGQKRARGEAAAGQRIGIPAEVIGTGAKAPTEAEEFF